MCQRVEGETKLVNEEAKNWVALQKNINTCSKITSIICFL